MPASRAAAALNVRARSTVAVVPLRGGRGPRRGVTAKVPQARVADGQVVQPRVGPLTLLLLLLRVPPGPLREG